MNDTVRQFIERWVSNNIQAEGYQLEGDNSEARQRAKECQAGGLQEGYTAAELDVASADMFWGGDNLVDLMANAIEDANDAECERRAEKDG